jgi:hypothetical protein
MRVLPPSGLFRRQALGLPTAAALDEEGLKIGAALAWISHHGNLEDFPGSRSERMALMATAIRRGLAAWDRGQDRYKLTKLGKMQAAGYAPTLDGAKAPAQDSPVVKGDLGGRLLDRFENRPHLMIGAFFAIGIAVGAAAAWVPSTSDPGDARSALPASSQTSSDSSATAISNELSARRSPVGAPQDRSQAAGVPAAPTPASPSRGTAVSTGIAPEPVAPRQAQMADPTTSARQEERAPMATLSGSVAATRAIGHFESVPSADVAPQSTSTTKLLDPQAKPEPKGARHTPLKSASQHRGREAKTQHAGAAPGAGRTPSWSQQSDEDGRPMLAPQARRGPNVAEDSIEGGTPRYHQSRRVTPNFDRQPRSTHDDPMGLVGWLFY